MRRDLLVPVRRGVEVSVGVTAEDREGAAASGGADVVYLHGGGLLYGRRDDLPRAYAESFLSRGYRLWSLDYPLAPEATCAQIRDAVLDEIGWLAAHEGLGAGRPLVLFGRSAGAYLALGACRDLLAAGGPVVPQAVLSFYGYADLTASFVHEPSCHYASMPPLSDATPAAFSEDEVLTRADIERRYALYLYARQRGRWAQLLGIGDERDALALSVAPEELAGFPPTFLTASSSDADVPFRMSKELARSIPRSRMYAVYYLEHDFDRDPGAGAGARVYTACLDWLDGVLGTAA